MNFTRIKVTAVRDTGVFVARDNTSGYYVFSALEPKPVSVGDILRIPDWKLGEDPLQTATWESNGQSLAVSVECWGGARPVALRMLEHIGNPNQARKARGGHGR